jgi:hypothetical protein
LSAGEYRELLLSARRSHLKMTRETVQRFESVLSQAGTQLARLYSALPAEGADLRRRYLKEKQAEVKDLLKNLHDDYGQLLGAGLS